MNITAEESRLSPEQVQDFRDEGYLIYDKPVLPQAKFDALKAYFEKMLAAWPAETRPEAMDVPHFVHPELFKWAFDEAVLGLVEPILGPDIALFSTHFICKPKGNGKRVPWHEDSAYWKGRMDPMEVVTVWLAIDPSTRENGCMMVIPQTHRTGQKGFSDYADVDYSKNVFPVEILEKQRDESKRVYLELPPNHASLHDARTQHGSEPNTSAMRRCGWTLRFTSSAVKFTGVNDAHVVYLAKGRNLAGTPFGDPTKVYADVMERRAISSKYKNSH